MPDEPVVVETPAAPVVETPAAPLTAEQEDAALDTLIEEKGVDIPGDVDGRLVPLAAVTSLRGKLKEARADAAAAKAGGTDSEALKARVAELEAAYNEARPLADAYKVYARLNPEQPDPNAAADKAASDAELEEIARDELYYDNAGNLDLARAGRHRDRIHKAAEKIADAKVAPYAAQTVQGQSRAFLASAKATKAPNGQQPDPGVLDSVWAKLDPSVTSTREGAIQAWNVALGYSVAMGKAVGAPPVAAREALPTPLLIERSGGRDPIAAPTASAADQRAAKDLGLSVTDYLKEVGDMPAGWGKSQR